MNTMLQLLASSESGLGAHHDFWLPPQGSTAAANTDFAFMFILWICYFFFFLILILMVAFVIRYRQKGKEIGPGGPAHHTPLEVTWTVIPTLLVVAIFYFGFKGFLQGVVPPNDAFQIDVTAQQWSWDFKYPNGASSLDGNLYVPAGQPVKLVLRSEDVLHALFIPDFRLKKDVVPGRYTTVWFEAPEATGEDPQKAHSLFCAEYCGKDHSRMNRQVFVLSKEDFALWMEKSARWLDPIPDEELYYKAGPIFYKRCQSCHSLDGTPGTGPSWGPHDGFGAIWDRTSKGTTKLDGGKTLSSLIGPGKEYETPEDYIRESILNPGKHIVDGFGNAMPTFQGQLKPREIQAIIDMMKHLSEFNPDGSWKGAGAAQKTALK